MISVARVLRYGLLLMLVACTSDDSLPVARSGPSLFAPSFMEPAEPRGDRKPSGTAALRLSAQAGLCGDPRLVGVALPPIANPVPGCGVDNPVRVFEVAGVTLNGTPTLNCNMALSFAEYVERGLKPIIGKRGGGVNSLNIAAGYVCRPRNNRPGARLSEHSTGNAIDISAINLSDGTRLTVQDDWRSDDGDILHALHARACGPFGTVLGPDSDVYHQDHFHFDLAIHGNGAYCR